MSADIRKFFSIILSVALGLATLVGFSVPAANAAPAYVPPTLPANWDGYGLKEIERFVGKYQASTDGFSGYYSADPAHTYGDLQVSKTNDGAVVARAYLTSSSGDNGGATTAAPAATINGQVVTWSTRNHAGKFTNYLADVTPAVKTFLDGELHGTANVPVVYDARGVIPGIPDYSTGVALTVIYQDSSMTTDASVIMYFGSSNSSGQNLTLSFDPRSSSTSNAWLSLGIGWSQGNSQYSNVKVKNDQSTSFTDLSGSAGGCDDTVNNSGCADSRLGLLTVGGVGDSTANPASIGQNVADDELYNMDAFLNTGVSKLIMNTTNPSGDDNIFQAVISVPFLILYEANFDSAGGSAVPTEYWTGSVRGLSTSVRAGYSFDGWFLQDGTSPVSFPYTPASLANQQFYAHWTQNTYTATFDTHGGSAVADIVYTTSVRMPAAPTRSGFTFTGWYTAATGGNYIGLTYTPNPLANVTIHAHWYAQPANNSGGGSTSSPTPTPTTEPPVAPVEVKPTVIPRKIATLVVAGFADGSPILAAITKSKITKFVAAHKTYKKAACTGYTEGPTVLKTDAALSTKRGKNACDLVIQLTNKKVTVTSISAVQSQIENALNRRVKIVLMSR